MEADDMGEQAYRVWVVFGSCPGPATTVPVEGAIRLVDGVEYVGAIGAMLSRFDPEWHRSRKEAWECAVRTLEAQAKRLLEQAAAIRRKEGLDAVCPSA
jgi:hypothetical protein